VGEDIRFFGLGLFVRFCRVFWQKRVIEGGFLVVNSWRNRGELWLVDGRILVAKNMPRIPDLFSGDSLFGNHPLVRRELH
jgi:hypothetical protein